MTHPEVILLLCSFSSLQDLQINCACVFVRYTGVHLPVGGEDQVQHTVRAKQISEALRLIMDSVHVATQEQR